MRAYCHSCQSNFFFLSGGIPPHPTCRVPLQVFSIILRPLYLKGLHLSLYPLSSGEGKNVKSRSRFYVGFSIAGRRDVLIYYRYAIFQR